jgi:hypothetical protein
MRPLIGIPLIVALALAAATATASAADNAQGGSLSIESARGSVQLRGRGVLIVRIARGAAQVVDQSPADQWSPMVNGAAARGRSVNVRGTDINLYLLGGRFKLLVRGEGVSVSVRGEGQVVMDGDPDASGVAGVVRVGDEPERIVGDEFLRFGFGTAGSTGLTAGAAVGSTQPGADKSGSDKSGSSRSGEDDSRSKER